MWHLPSPNNGCLGGWLVLCSFQIHGNTSRKFGFCHSSGILLLGMILHAILKGCMKMTGYLITPDTPLIYFHEPFHLHDSVATVRCSVTADESSLISLRKASASVQPFQFPPHQKYLPLFRKHISSLSYVLAEGHACLQYLSAGTQHHYTYILPFNEAIFESTSTGKEKTVNSFIKLALQLFCKMQEKQGRSANRTFSRMLHSSQCIERAQLLAYLRASSSPCASTEEV